MTVIHLRHRNCVLYATLPTNSRPTGFPVAKHALDCVLTWQTAVRVRGSMVGPALQNPLGNLAQETS
jgi:hypothetical protein